MSEIRSIKSPWYVVKEDRSIEKHNKYYRSRSDPMILPLRSLREMKYSWSHCSSHKSPTQATSYKSYTTAASVSPFDLFNAFTESLLEEKSFVVADNPPFDLHNDSPMDHKCQCSGFGSDFTTIPYESIPVIILQPPLHSYDPFIGA